MAFDQRKVDRVCELLAGYDEAKSLRQACEIVGITASTFLYWCDERPNVAEQYARANNIAVDLAFENFNDLNEEQPPQVKGFTDTGWVAWQRMRLDNQKWAMSKRRPSKYSDRIQQEHTGANGGPVEFTVKSILDSESK